MGTGKGNAISTPLLIVRHFTEGTVMDTRFEQVVKNCESSLMVFGDPTFNEWKFMELGTSEVSDIQTLINQGWRFFACIGVDSQGKIATALNFPGKSEAAARMCRAFEARCQSEWFAQDMEKIFAMPDTRPDRMVN